MGLEAESQARGGSELAPGLSSVGGSQNLRFYWKEFVNEVDVLVFMVDSADRLRLPWARQELHKLLDKDPDLPVVVVANKQVRAAGGCCRQSGLIHRCLGRSRYPGQGVGLGLACGPGILSFTSSCALASCLTLLLSAFLSSVLLQKRGK